MKFLKPTTLRSSEWTLLVATTTLIAYPAWARGGTQSGFREPMLWIALWTLFLFLITPALDRQATRQTGRTNNASNASQARIGKWAHLLGLLRDPTFYCGLAFLALIGIQWWNAGRERIFDREAYQWIWSVPRMAAWPAAVNPHDAKKIFQWFCPAFVLLWTLRHGLRSITVKRWLLAVVLVNAWLLAVFGIVQFASGTNRIFWVSPLSCHFFASFGYSNHAGAYYELLYAITLGTFFTTLQRKQRHGQRVVVWQSTFLLLCAATFLLSIHLTLCRAAIIFSWVLTLAAGFYGIRHLKQHIHPATQIRIAVGCAGIVILAVLALPNVETTKLGKEIQSLCDKNMLQKAVATRQWQLETAWAIATDHWRFGVGAEGYKKFVGMYLPKEQWHLLKTKKGKSNVHNDILQFFVEFGLSGLLLLAATMLTVAWAWLQRLNKLWSMPYATLAFMGIGIVLGHSLIDLPFRSPAVLYIWLLALALGPTLWGTNHPDGLLGRSFPDEYRML